MAHAHTPVQIFEGEAVPALTLLTKTREREGGNQAPEMEDIECSQKSRGPWGFVERN